MITVAQIRAARALLDWKQGRLADESGVSLPAIARLEQGVGSPRTATVEALQKAFESNGIEFFGENGVDLRREQFRVDILEGLNAMQVIWDDVVATCTGKKLEFLMSGIEEQRWADMYGDKVGDEMVRRFKLKIKSRLLIKEGDNLCTGSDDAYRCVPEIVFGQTPYMIYADRYALINWEPFKIVLIRSQSVADTFRRQFELNWKLGMPVKNPKIMFPLFP